MAAPAAFDWSADRFEPSGSGARRPEGGDGGRSVGKKKKKFKGEKAMSVPF